LSLKEKTIMAEEIVLNVPVNGMGPVDVTMQDPPPGAWEAEITDVVVKTKQGEGGGKTTMHVTVSICEPGPAQGITTMGFIGTDWSKDFNVKHFVNLFTGIMQKLGKTDEEIKAKLVGVVQLPLSNLRGKHCFIFVKSAPDEVDEFGRKPFADKNFITMKQYEAAKKAGTVIASKPKNGATAGATAPAGAAGGPPVPAPGAGAIPSSGGPPPPTPGAGAGAAIGDLFG
jgi:hypothetical protein